MGNMMSKIEKPEKIVGYVLLIVGLAVVIIPTYIGISIIFTARARAHKHIMSFIYDITIVIS